MPIGRVEALADISEKAGLDRADTTRLLEAGEYAGAVRVTESETISGTWPAIRSLMTELTAMSRDLPWMIWRPICFMSDFAEMVQHCNTMYSKKYY